MRTPARVGLAGALAGTLLLAAAPGLRAAAPRAEAPPAEAGLAAYRAGDDARARELLTAWAAGRRARGDDDPASLPRLLALGELQAEGFAHAEARKTFASALALAEQEAAKAPAILAEALLASCRAGIRALEFDGLAAGLDRAAAAAHSAGAEGQVVRARIEIARAELALAQPGPGAARRAATALGRGQVALEAAGSPPQASAELLEARGMLELVRNRTDEAEAALVAALRLRAARYGEKSPRLAEGLARLGAARSLERDFAGAADAYRLALTLREASLPAGHPEIGNAAFRLAEALQGQYRAREAEPFYRTSLAIARSAGIASPGVESLVQRKLAQNLQAQKRFPAAAAEFEAIARREEAARPRDPEALAGALRYLGDAQQQGGDLEGALGTYRKLLELQEQPPAAPEPMRAVTSNLLAGLMARLGRAGTPTGSR